MNLYDASRAVIVAHEHVRQALEQGAARQATPEDLGVALVALDSAVNILRRELNRGVGPCCCGALVEEHPWAACVIWHAYDPCHSATRRGDRTNNHR